MQKFHPSAKRAWLYAVVGFVLFSALAMALTAYFAVGIDGVFLVAFAAVIAFLYAASATAVATLTTYSLENDTLSMERSAISVSKQIIPIKNIDNLHTQASIVGRLLSITDVYVDTPGGFGYEMVMRDVPQAAADELLGQVEALKKI
jgi:uncharacterized membrane protein YdbT with pleckstrin-like domain